MRYDLSPHSRAFSDYTELRIQENRTTRIVMVKGHIAGNERKAESGVSARVYRKGSWGFSSTPQIDDDAISAVIASATENAGFLAGKENNTANTFSGEHFETENDFSTQKPKKSQKDMVDFLKGLDAYIARKYKALSSRTLMLNCLGIEKTLLTSTGSSAYSLIPRTVLHIMLASEKEGYPIELNDIHGGLGFFEDRFEKPDDLFDTIDIQHEHLMKKREGVYADAGIKDCILDAQLAGILAHEAIGHTTEADIVLGGSVAGDHLNEQIASPFITLVDFAHTAFKAPCPFPVFCDDEGTAARDVVLIKEGVLKNYLLNKETAAHFNMNPAGNARASRFCDEPLIRMRNTAILPGRDILDDMVSSIDHGYYVMRASNGQADATSEFMFGITLAYEIKNGKIGMALKDTTISGVAFDVLNTITMISERMEWASGGMCGKKQLIPVGMGGPAVKCKINFGGK